MTNTTISPFVVGQIEQVELSDGKGGKQKYWKKEILPSGTRKYNGTNLDFSKINPACKAAFDEKAVDGVPFVLALADNKHPETGQELEKLEGDLARLEMGQEGNLFGYFTLTDDVVKKIEASNKKLGVSARIDVDYERKDIGKTYPYALKHVCATTAPHIKGMKPWEVVELTEDEKKDTIDFSTEVIETPVNNNENKETGDDLVAVEIPKAQFDKLMAFIGDIEKGEELANKLNEGGGGDGGTQTAQLSEEATKRIELAEKSAQDAIALAEQSQREAAKTKWESRERELALAGVPPVMLTEAKKVLSLPKPVTYQLTEKDGANTKITTVDASEVIEKILDAAKGTIKLGQEDGHPFDGVDSNTDEYTEFEKAFFSNFDA